MVTRSSLSHLIEKSYQKVHNWTEKHILVLPTVNKITLLSIKVIVPIVEIGGGK